MSAPADLGLVHRLLEETGAERVHPPPAWSGYLEVLAKASVEWLRDRVPGLQGLSTLPVRFGLLVAVVAAVLVAGLLYLVARRTLQRSAGPHATDAAVPVIPRASLLVEHDREGWRREVDRRLAAGDLEGTLEALWWWFARSVSRDRVDPSWTSHELLARCARPDLTPLARVLDRLLYGPQRPRSDDVRRFVGRIEEALP